MTGLTQPSVYIALADYQFDWTLQEIKRFKANWKAGEDIQTLAKQFGRDQIEVAVLIMDLAEKGEIKQRSNGIGGMIGVLYE